jgi:hypothetical protein
VSKAELLVNRISTSIALGALLTTTPSFPAGSDEAQGPAQPESTQEASTEERAAREEKPETEEASMLLGDDGWFDISKFVDQAYGFVPLVIPITEPAVGYGAVGLLAFGYYPASDKVTLGLKIGARSAHGDMPFYQLPFIQLRGVPALRYQGDFAGEFEAEVRWQFYKRFSVVGFGGHGIARFEDDRGTTNDSATTWGLGFRYEIARGYQMHMGLDVARGPEDTIFYLQFGSAWFAP